MRKSLSSAVAVAVLAMANAAFAAEAGAPVAVETDAEEYAIDEVLVTAERMPATRMNTPANVSVVTAQEIADNHYKTAAEALQHVNGVSVEQTGTHDFVSLNGNERVVFLIDGRKMNNEQGAATGTAMYNLSMLPSMENIERIEVVKGGGSALYGSDAVGGVINIITKKVKTSKTTLDINGGSWKAWNYELTTQGAVNGLDWFLTGGIQKRDHVGYKAQGRNGGGDKAYPRSGKLDNNSFSANLGYTINDRRSVRVVFDHKSNHDWSWLNESHHTGRADKARHEVFNNMAVSYNFKEGTKTPGVLRYYNNNKTSEFYGGFNTNLQGLDYQNGWELGDHTLIAGAEWHESKSSNISSRYTDEKMRNAAAFVQDTWKLAGKWSLVPGLRVNHHSEYGNKWLPKVAVNYNANDKTQVYASWGRVFRSPTADDLYSYIGMSVAEIDAADPYASVGNPDLKPETGYTATIGMTHKFTKDMTAELSVFQSKLHDAITWMYDPSLSVLGGSHYRVYNMDTAKQRGLELSFKHRLNDNWSYDLGYSYLHQEGAVKGVEQGNRSNAQPNGYRAGLRFKNGPFKANLFVTAKSGLDSYNYARKSYALVDLNLSYDITKDLVVYLKGLNLTNQEYSAYKGRVGNRYYGLGRRVMLGMTYSF